MKKKNRILIIDDDHDIVFASRMRLMAAGYDTQTAGDGRTGLEAADQTHPDAILLDVRMPEMDGLSVLLQLKNSSQTRSIPVVMLSASVVDEEAALNAGANFFVRKPYQGLELIAAVDSAIELDKSYDGSRPQNQ